MERNIINLEILDDLPESGVSAISLVDYPAIEKDWLAFKKEKFVEPSGGESKDDFLPRCIAYNVNEGKDTDQAAAICYSVWENHSKQFDIEPNPCWEGYEPFGLKDDGTPNCIPVKANKEAFAESYTDYPEGAVNNAKRALEWADKNGWGDCGMGAGKARANQLANREAISEDTIARMSAFERHRQNSDTPYSEGCGKLMWDAWGGDAGIRWAHNKLREIRGGDFSYDVSSLPSYTEEVPKKKKSQYDLMGIPLPRGEKVILQAEDKDYSRGLIVELLPEGGYNVEYWFNDPSNIVPSEVKVDDKLVTKEGTTTYLGYHPELYAEKLSKLFFASQDQQIVVGPAMIPDMEILRKDDEGKPYYVKFTKEVIQRIAEKFMMELRNHDTNIQHDETDPAHSFVMETWLVENPEDKANSLYKMDVPIGTWMVKMRVLDPETWKMIKAGKLNGFSIEGSFMSESDYEAYKKDREIYDRIIKILKSV